MRAQRARCQPSSSTVVIFRRRSHCAEGYASRRGVNCGCHETRWGDHRLRINRSRRGLRAVYVDAAYGGQGVGRALLARLEELARDAGAAELRIDVSVNAVPFYEANGAEEYKCPTEVTRTRCRRNR